MSSPARLYAALIGAILVIVGIIGFFYEASFATGTADVSANSDKLLGILAVNGWHNLVHITIGLAGLAMAGSNTWARFYAFVFGALYLVLAIWGFAESDNVLVGLLPVNGGDNVLHLVVGVLGLAAAAATPSEEPPPPLAA
jgi:hypothetical protein